MSAALLAKLKVKNEPKQRENIAIVMPEAAPKLDIIIKTQIRDKTKQVAFDRKSFLTSIRPKLAVETKKEIIKEEIPIERPELINIAPKTIVKKIKKRKKT